MEYTGTDTQKLRSVKYFLLDMDGTIYLDTTLFDGTLDFLSTLKAQGKGAVYITNNSSKAVTQYVEKLARLGIDSCPEDFCTSANALVFNLKKFKPNARIFLLGTPVLEEYLEQEGFTIVREYTKSPDKVPDYVVLAFDLTLTYDKLRIACDYLADGVEYWATHPDKVCPMEAGRFIPDAGAFMACIETATGRTPSFIAGKPNPCIINMVMEQKQCPPEDIAVMGDRLNTDILSAVNAGVTSICVLSGEATLEDIKALPEKEKPTFIFDSIKDVWEVIK